MVSVRAGTIIQYYIYCIWDAQIHTSANTGQYWSERLFVNIIIKYNAHRM